MFEKYSEEINLFTYKGNANFIQSNPMINLI